jgi:hypothetical protein
MKRFLFFIVTLIFSSTVQAADATVAGSFDWYQQRVDSVKKGPDILIQLQIDSGANLGNVSIVEFLLGERFSVSNLVLADMSLDTKAPLLVSKLGGAVVDMGASAGSVARSSLASGWAKYTTALDTNLGDQLASDMARLEAEIAHLKRTDSTGGTSTPPPALHGSGSSAGTTVASGSVSIADSSGEKAKKIFAKFQGDSDVTITQAEADVLSGLPDEQLKKYNFMIIREKSPKEIIVAMRNAGVLSGTTASTVAVGSRGGSSSELMASLRGGSGMNSLGKPRSSKSNSSKSNSSKSKAKKPLAMLGELRAYKKGNLKPIIKAKKVRKTAVSADTVGIIAYNILMEPANAGMLEFVKANMHLKNLFKNATDKASLSKILNDKGYSAGVSVSGSLDARRKAIVGSRPSMGAALAEKAKRAHAKFKNTVSNFKISTIKNKYKYKTLCTLKKIALQPASYSKDVLSFLDGYYKRATGRMDADDELYNYGIYKAAEQKKLYDMDEYDDDDDDDDKGPVNIGTMPDWLSEVILRSQDGCVADFAAATAAQLASTGGSADAGLGAGNSVVAGSVISTVTSQVADAAPVVAAGLGAGNSVVVPVASASQEDAIDDAEDEDDEELVLMSDADAAESLLDIDAKAFVQTRPTPSQLSNLYKTEIAKATPLQRAQIKALINAGIFKNAFGKQYKGLDSWKTELGLS